MTNLIKILILFSCLFNISFSSIADSKIRDPTTPVVKDPSGLKIQGIAESEGEFYCLINDKIYRENDEILDFKIKKIENDRVYFEDFEGLTTEISL